MIHRTLLIAAILALGVLSACQGGGRRGNAGQEAREAEAKQEFADAFAQGAADGGPGAPAAPAKPKGPAIVVTWEALAHEKHLLENSRFRRNGPQPPQKITLISSSHPDAASLAMGRARQQDPQTSTAILDDKDMVLFVQGLQRSGFFRYARPAGYDTAAAASDSARGRVTVTRGGDSRSLLSVRGQGLNEKTKEIPRIYSETKQAIMVLRNMTPTLNVTRSGATGNIRVR